VVVGALIVGLVWLGASGVPEGPPGPVFVPRPRRADELPLELVRDFVRTPLPAPLHQPGGCDNSGDLVIVLKGSGRTITYGPCRWPWQISELWGAMIESGDVIACASRNVPRAHVCEALTQARRRPLRAAS
jgi:hypothetical protein